ncbi:MAG: leucine-rich repeat domain-containing protein [Clostridia bacterium]|nr:leucine-rich repeat domain-containing protein [Clostridia bacterium]
MKKLLSIVLTLVMIFGVFACVPFSASALAKRYDSGDYSYTLKNGKATLRRYEGKGKKIFKIPSKLDGYPVVKIGVCAFEGIDFETVIIPEGVTTIDAAFYWCEALKTVKIPKSVTNITSRFSQDCDNVANIEVDKDNAYYCDVDGVLFNKDKTKLIEYPPKKKDKAYNIPNGIERICLHAFENSTSLENVTIPDSVKTIGKRAFWNSSIKSIKMSKNITRIGAEAFNGTKYWKNLDNWKNHGLYIDNYFSQI